MERIVEEQVGSDIYFGIKIRKPDGTYYNITNELADLYCSVSNESGLTVIKFSKTLKTDFTQLIKLTDQEYLALLTSDNTTSLGQGHFTVSVDKIITTTGTGDGRRNSKSQKLSGYLQSNSLQNDR
jgi:hypothetical protein